ncbi:short-chain alcohol dehydrogenase [Kalmusia sp. IMI 367209]|nr:short-chain alcohol dehydrogenase [Kalmusia sp. IMI 367209]
MGQKYSALFNQTFFLPQPAFTEEELGDQSGKVVIITGGYAGIGLALAHILYVANATIYLAGRSPSKASTAIEELKNASPESKGRVEFLHLDLADLPTIKPAVQSFFAKESRLDVLVNNAGIMWPPEGSRSVQGYDLQVATNVYGPFLLTLLLHPLLAETAKGSDEGKSFNPGNLVTDLTRHASWIQKLSLKPLLYPVKFGAYTELFAGWSPEITKEKSGCYVLPWGRIGGYNSGLEKAVKRVEDGGEGKAEKLWEVCWEICRPYM